MSSSSNDSNQGQYGINELAVLGGVSRRTVRYYVQRGLLPTPTGTGRGKHYTQEHLELLVRIRHLQEEGVSLAEIQERLREPQPSSGRVVPAPQEGTTEVPGPTRAPLAPEIPRTHWVRIELAPGLELHVDQRLSLGPEALQSIAQAIEQIVKRGSS